MFILEKDFLQSVLPSDIGLNDAFYIFMGTLFIAASLFALFSLIFLVAKLNTGIITVGVIDILLLNPILGIMMLVSKDVEQIKDQLKNITNNNK